MRPHVDDHRFSKCLNTMTKRESLNTSSVHMMATETGCMASTNVAFAPCGEDGYVTPSSRLNATASDIDRRNLLTSENHDNGGCQPVDCVPVQRDRRRFPLQQHRRLRFGKWRRGAAAMPCKTETNVVHGSTAVY